MIAGVALLAVGLLGWRQWLPRNRFAGIRTPATLRSDAAFIAANRVAALPILAAGVIYAVAGDPLKHGCSTCRNGTGLLSDLRVRSVTS